jgi:nicotinamide riboside transporter PnuC
MEKLKRINYIYTIIALITGSRLLQHFNFETYSFKTPALDAIFLVTFILAVYLIIKEYSAGSSK